AGHILRRRAGARECAARGEAGALPQLVGVEVPAEAAAALGGVGADRERTLAARARLHVEQHAADAASPEIDSHQQAAHRRLSSSSSLKRSNSTLTAPCSPCA